VVASGAAISGRTGTPHPARRFGLGVSLYGSCYWSSANSPWGALANSAPILIFAVSPEDRRSRLGVFALRTPISLQPYALRRDPIIDQKRVYSWQKL
jgi:hypothetical protein